MLSFKDRQEWMEQRWGTPRSSLNDIKSREAVFIVVAVIVVIIVRLFRLHSENSGLLIQTYLSFQDNNASVHFPSVQLLFATPWTAAHQASLSITNSWSLLKLMSFELAMPSNHLILCNPLLLLSSIFPSIRVFSNGSVLFIRWPKYWSFSFNISPSNEHSGLISFRMDWLDLLAVQVTLKSLLQHHSAKASILQQSAFFIVQLSHPYKVKVKSLSRVQCFATPQTAAHQALPSLRFFRQERWSGFHFLLQCMKVKSEVAQSYPTLSDPMDCSLPGTSIHGICQARVLDWVAITFSTSIHDYWKNHSFDQMDLCWQSDVSAF